MQSHLVFGAILTAMGAGLIFAINPWFNVYSNQTIFGWGVLLISIHIIGIAISILYQIKTLAEKRESLWLEIRQTKKLLLENYLKGVTEEKQRIANELKHHVIKEIVTLESRLSKSSRTTEETKLELNNIKNSISTITNELIGSTTKDSSFINRIKQFVELHQTRELTFKFQYFNFSGGITSTQEDHLFKIILESVNNIEKHANASHVEIQIIQNETELILSIEDNGTGFYAQNKTDGIGILNMKQRAFEMNASIKIYSSPTSGTSIFIVLFI